MPGGRRRWRFQGPCGGVSEQKTLDTRAGVGGVWLLLTLLPLWGVNPQAIAGFLFSHLRAGEHPVALSQWQAG
jgi:hypothetical protein